MFYFPFKNFPQFTLDICVALYQLPTITLRAFECLTDLPQEPPLHGLETTWDSVRLAQPLSFTLSPTRIHLGGQCRAPQRRHLERRIAFPGCQPERNKEKGRKERNRWLLSLYGGVSSVIGAALTGRWRFRDLSGILCRRPAIGGGAREGKMSLAR